MSVVTGWRICHHREQTLSAVRKEWFKPITHETTNTIKSVTYLRDVWEPPYRKLKIEHDFPSWTVFATSSIVKINTGCVTAYCFAHKAMLLWTVCSRSWVALHVSEIGLQFAGFHAHRNLDFGGRAVCLSILFCWRIVGLSVFGSAMDKNSISKFCDHKLYFSWTTLSLF